MEFALFCTKVNILILILALCSPCKFIQSPMDFGPSNLLETKSSASLDFGRIVFNSPSAVLRPQSPRDISLLLTFLSASSFSKVTVAARGAGHSIYGQAQALDGIVIEMDSIPSDIYIHKKRDDESGFSYADVGGGALWVELLEESLKLGLAPRSWTDYLYLSIGGTLSNGGIKLFYAVLGGLGQFGIITRARILLQDAPPKVRLKSCQCFLLHVINHGFCGDQVKWIRAFYDDFDTFTGDQELLVSMPELVDYVEGFIVPNEQSLLSTSVAFPAHLGFMPEFHHVSSAKVYYCIEFAVHDFQSEGTSAEQVVEKISKQMSHMPSLMYSVEVSYFDFLNRVRMEEMNLRSRGLWELKYNSIFLLKLIPPLLKFRWDANTSVALPDAPTGGDGVEQVVYIVGMLRSANPASSAAWCLDDILHRNRQIAEAASAGRIGGKQYLAHHPSLLHWRDHFGRHWNRFAARKNLFDPLGVLAPGQGIFPRVPASTL
ncbi:hypothetical protein GW17_00022858 [Ensete ventricosum]|nr:hypothetical protein GW17_00022858 [Ensete ventricosum]